MFRKKKKTFKTYKKGIKVYVKNNYTDVCIGISDDKERINGYVIDKSVYNDRGESYYLLKPLNKKEKPIWKHKSEILLIGEE